MKKMNDSIVIPEDKPLAYATVERTEAGFYKITYYNFNANDLILEMNSVLWMGDK